ncbi:unnamed protein product [Pleuronectes platessa]|uniref:Uncharacterized protein n=1 Tax=Pleuronectes platessa TaxID=8262 RepID=A0A9N7Y9B5_PLEPL|nr:unnamed protein product [Pleuronectes platessa]
MAANAHWDGSSFPVGKEKAEQELDANGKNDEHEKHVFTLRRCTGPLLDLMMINTLRSTLSRCKKSRPPHYYTSQRTNTQLEDIQGESALSSSGFLLGLYCPPVDTMSTQPP